MSVTGEFHRLVADCIACLDRGDDGPDTDRWQEALRTAAGLSEHSLPRAAEAALELLHDRDRMPQLAPTERRDEFAGLVDHLAAICRVILGRPAHETQDRREP